MASSSTLLLTIIITALLFLILPHPTTAITAWDWVNGSQPISVFRSRPDLQAPILTPLGGLHNPAKMAPGYYFVAPYTNMQPGVYIYDNNLDLVWSSYGSAGAGQAHGPQVCDYAGGKHLCFYQGVQHVGWGHGHGLILDRHYRIVRSVEPSGTGQTSSDMHEFYLIENGKRALMTQYVRHVFDMCAFGSCDGLGYIQSGVFQEVDVETGEAVFTWDSLDHVRPEESLVLPRSTEISGDGESPEIPWDYFHINSVDKSDFDGGYLLSARHTCALYKISGTTGKVLWRLGGLESDFEMGEGVTFAFQHDARWITDSKYESVISIFDNGGNGWSTPEPHSKGMVVRLDHRTKRATLVSTLDPPAVDGYTHASKSQGNYQTRLSNGGSILGWGNDPYITEYAEDGEIVFFGTLASGWMMNYRVQKFDGWVGEPLSKPAIWAFSQFGTEEQESDGHTMVIYVSWNGHTGVESWNFYGSDNRDGPWEVLANDFEKEGFETIYKHERTWKYVYAEATGRPGRTHGRTYGKTLVQKTFVPNVLMRERYCDELACNFMDTNNPNREVQMAQMKGEWEMLNNGSSKSYSAEPYEDEPGSVSEEVPEEVSEEVPDDMPDDVLEEVPEEAPEQVTQDASSSQPRGMTAYAIIFAVLSSLVFGMFGLAVRRSMSLQNRWHRLLTQLGLKTKRWQAGTRGEYFGINNDESDDGDDGYGEGGKTQDGRLMAQKETELELERQAFWRNRP